MRKESDYMRIVLQLVGTVLIGFFMVYFFMNNPITVFENKETNVLVTQFVSVVAASTLGISFVLLLHRKNYICRS